MRAVDRMADADGRDRLQRGLRASPPGQTHLRPEHGIHLQPPRMAAIERTGVFRLRYSVFLRLHHLLIVRFFFWSLCKSRFSLDS